MLIPEVDVIRLQAPQRLLDHFANVFGAAICSLVFSVLDAKPELGRNHRLLASPFERTPEKLFIHERAIGFRCVKEGDAAFKSVSYELHGICAVSCRPEAKA